MAHISGSHGGRSSGFLTAHHSHPSSADEFKASYDDLIDTYSEPNPRISRHHQIYKVHTDVATAPDSRKSSYSIEKKSPYSTESANVMIRPSQSAQIYPPIQQPSEKAVDDRSFFAKVGQAFNTQTLNSYSFRSFLTPGHVDFSCSLSSSRQL